MFHDRKYWILTLGRGLIAVSIGAGIFALPDLARTIFLLPISVTISLILFACYGIVDGILLIVASYATHIPLLRWTHRAQGIASLTVGALLLSFYFERARLSWFLTLAALQAGITACSEFFLAKHARTNNARIWDYGATVVAGIFGIAYIYVRIFLTSQLTYAEVSWLIYAFLIAFGVAQCTNAAAMLSEGDGHSGRHPLRNK